MSRRRGEFEHRTSIFEGAFRAWSHLGGIEPLHLETKQASDLDPLNFPLANDPRLAAQRGKGRKQKSENGIAGGDDFDSDGNSGGGGGGGGDIKQDSNRPEYPYEPLPRSGLAHPFVQAILSPWLGPDADQDAIQLGLTTLRTWWQHRRKGESGSAVVALGTDKMKGVVEGYTRHFFNLAHCLIVNDKEQPPRTLQGKMRDLEKSRNKKGKKRNREDESIKAAAMAFQSGFGVQPQPSDGNNNGINPNNIMSGGQMGGAVNGNNNQNDGLSDMSPLDHLHAAQRRQLTASGGVLPMGGGEQNPPSLKMKGQCIPGKVDLPGLVQQVSSAATQLAHRGMSANSGMNKLSSIDPSKYGDPNVTPIVIVSHPNTGNNNGNNNNTGSTATKTDMSFCMTIDGITCAHCVKIVETVLKGCPGSRSPISGLLDAAADMQLCIVLVKIANINDCRRIAHEAARNLSMVGYTAKAKSVTVPTGGGAVLRDVYGVMEGTIPNVSPRGGFDWRHDCGCPDNNVLRQDCPRHSQMGHGIIEAFDQTARLVFDFISGCSKKTGMPCTAGVHCFCRSNSSAGGVASASNQQHETSQHQSAESMAYHQNSAQGNSNNDYLSYQQPIQDSAAASAAAAGGGDDGVNNNNRSGNDGAPSKRQAQSSMRMSFPGLGGLGRHLSLGSETTFGRAMSGLSALSIDWENMDDFDVNVDHSAGINNDIINGQKQDPNNSSEESGQQQQQQGGGGQDGEEAYGQQHQQRGPRVARRSSLRKNIPMNPNGNFNVSFA